MSDENEELEYPSAIFEEPEEDYDTSKLTDDGDDGSVSYDEVENDTIDTTGSEESVQQFRSKIDDIYENMEKWDDYLDLKGDVVANYVEGDQEIERSQTVGGNQVVRGSQLVEHDLFVKGHVIAGDIYGIDKQIDEQIDDKLENTVVPKAKHAEEADTAATAGYADVAGYATYAAGIADGSDYTNVVIDSMKKLFLSRLDADTAAGLITFIEGLIAKKVIKAEEGLQIGANYVDGMTGVGGFIDKYGNAVLESATIRRELIVPYLVYNRTEITVGNDWAAPGGGVIESVEPDVDEYGIPLTTGTATLKLEDGEPGAIAVDDICQGIWHNIGGGNSTVDSDDSRGNFTFAGFSTVYFRVTEILDETNNSKFRYALRPVSERWKSQHHPAESMTFVCYANPSDKTRQTSRYSTRTYMRFLSGCTTWEFSQNNIMAQFGDLTNLKVYGLDMTGYSAFMNNLYVSGTIQQVNAEPLRLELETDGDNFLTYGESLHVTCRAYRGWTEVTDKVTTWKVERDTADAAADSSWALRDKVKNFKGEIDLTLDIDPTVNDLGENENTLSTMFTFTATVETDENGNTEEIDTTMII